MTDELDLQLLDDPETMRIDPEMVDFDFSGDAWVWAPPWEFQNAYGADRRVWREDRPPLTTRLRKRMHPYEVAHFEDEAFRERLLDFTARVMLRRRVEGVEPEDMVQDVIVEMERVREREGFAVGSSDWMKVAQVVTRRRVTDVLRRMGGQKNRGHRLERREALMYGEYIATRGSRPFEIDDPEDDVGDKDPLSNLQARGFVAQVFSDELRERLATSLTPRELEAIVWTYEHDLSSEQVAERMSINGQSVRDLLVRARAALSIQFTNNSR